MSSAVHVVYLTVLPGRNQSIYESNKNVKNAVRHKPCHINNEESEYRAGRLGIGGSEVSSHCRHVYVPALEPRVSYVSVVV